MLTRDGWHVHSGSLQPGRADVTTFGGVIPILATPFRADDEALDLESWERLIEFMIELGVDGLTILGVLGESNRLTDQERQTLIRTAVALVRRRRRRSVPQPGRLPAETRW